MSNSLSAPRTNRAELSCSPGVRAPEDRAWEVSSAGEEGGSKKTQTYIYIKYQPHKGSAALKYCYFLEPNETPGTRSAIEANLATVPSPSVGKPFHVDTSTSCVVEQYGVFRLSGDAPLPCPPACPLVGSCQPCVGVAGCCQGRPRRCSLMAQAYTAFRNCGLQPRVSAWCPICCTFGETLYVRVQK